MQNNHPILALKKINKASILIITQFGLISEFNLLTNKY